jgi:hypothetical protein
MGELPFTTAKEPASGVGGTVLSMGKVLAKVG